MQCVKCTYGTFYNKTREKYLCVSYYVANSFQSFKSCSIDILVDHIRKQVHKLSIHYFCVEILANTQYLHHDDTNNRIFLSAFSPFERYFIPGVVLLPFDKIFLNGFYNYYLIPIKIFLVLLFYTITISY